MKNVDFECKSCECLMKSVAFECECCGFGKGKRRHDCLMWRYQIVFPSVYLFNAAKYGVISDNYLVQYG